MNSFTLYKLPGYQVLDSTQGRISWDLNLSEATLLMHLREASDSQGKCEDSSEELSRRKSRKLTLERIILAERVLRQGKMRSMVSCLLVASRR